MRSGVSTAVASPISNLTVLALEPEPEKARAIRHVVSAIDGAALTVVTTTHHLLDTLHDGFPDLVLLPALLPWGDEEQLFDALRAASDTHHLEVLVTPYEIADDPSDREDPDVPGGWRRLLRKTPQRTKTVGCSIRTFGERIEWALQCAQEARLERAERFQLFHDFSIGAPQNRRVHQRFTGNELPWLRAARLRGGTKIRLLDLSAGGALVQSDARLRRDAEGLLELIGPDGDSKVPFRVIRWQPSSDAREFPYVGAFAFRGGFEFDSMLGPGHIGLKDGALAPFLRQTDERHERDPRLTRDQLPWLSSVRLAWGPEVKLLNISKTGMLIETPSKIAPGSSAEFSISGPRRDLSVSTRVVRTEIGPVSSLGVKYHAAVSFTKELPLNLGPDELSAALHMLASLLNDVLADACGSGAGDVRELKETFAEGVRKLVRARQIAIVDSPASDAGAESIYFTVPGTSGSRAVLQVTFEPNHVPTEAEFRCLQSAAVMATTVLEVERLQVI